MKKVTKKTVAAAKEKFPSKPITPADIAENCADCPKPRKCREATFSRLEVSTMVLIVVLVYAWFVSDGLASL